MSSTAPARRPPRRRRDHGGRIVAIGTVSGSARQDHRRQRPRRGARLHRCAGPVGHDAPRDGNGESHIRQGITTEIIGEGARRPSGPRRDEASFRAVRLAFDWTGFDGYFDKLRERGTSINLGIVRAGRRRVREQVIGMDNRAPTAGRARSARRRSSIGRCSRAPSDSSSALIYPPASYTNTDELIALARSQPSTTASTSRTSAARAFAFKEAIGEAIRIGREAALPVVIYHLKIGAKANWGRMDEFAAAIEDARAQRRRRHGVPVSVHGRRHRACRRRCRDGRRRAAARRCSSA